jgi:HSP20 family protein
MSPYGGRGFYNPPSEMNRLFDEMFGNLGSTISRQQRTQQTQWAPALDVVREDGDLLIRAELPGVKREEVEITLHERVLTISGERGVEEQKEEQKEGSGYYVRERRHGSFRRSLVLPHEVEEGQISARFEDGVLEVRAPGAATELEPKRIQIQGSSGEGAGT